LVTGLVTELCAYRYLTKCFDPEDIRGRRLALREKKYEELVPKLYENVMKATGGEWENAQSTGIDLERLYNSLDFKPKINAIAQVLPEHRRVDYKKTQIGTMSNRSPSVPAHGSRSARYCPMDRAASRAGLCTACLWDAR